jgi:hypothetical protein
MSLEQRLYFPITLSIQLVDEQMGNPISKIAVTLTIFAQSKSDYHVGPPLSNREGIIFIKHNWIKNAIDNIRNSFIMDYTSTLEQCLSEIRIKVMSIDEINKAISAMKLFGIEKGSAEIAHSISDLKNANNKNFEPQAISVRLDNPNEASREILIRLRRSND